jgi:hypothetical protein
MVMFILTMTLWSRLLESLAKMDAIQLLLHTKDAITGSHFLSNVFNSLETMGSSQVQVLRMVRFSKLCFDGRSSSKTGVVKLWPL